MANPYPAVFRDDNSDTRLAGSVDFTDPANQPAQVVFARVSLSAPIANWDGAPIDFDVIDYDPDSLWDAANHWFAAKAAGWYEIAAYATNAGSGVGVSVPAISGTGTPQIAVVVGGAGNNLYAEVTQHTEVASGEWAFPPLFGHTHLDIGDTVDFEGVGLGANAGVGTGFAFSLRMVATT